MKLILACDSNGGIGYKNNLPWNKINGDLARFKKLTENQIVVMGRRTWESLPNKPLPKRLNIVITKLNLSMPNGAICLSNLDRLGSFNNVWLIGGAELISTNWDKIDTIHLTRTFTSYTCDRFIDLVEIENNFYLDSTEVNEDHNYEIWKRN